jgi:hypothetical protein
LLYYNVVVLIFYWIPLYQKSLSYLNIIILQSQEVIFTHDDIRPFIRQYDYDVVFIIFIIALYRL